MQIDRAEIFRLAWIWAKQEAWSRRMPKGGARKVFAACLRKAWAFHKDADARARSATPSAFASLPLADLQAAVAVQEACDRLGWAGIERLSEMRRELASRAA